MKDRTLRRSCQIQCLPKIRYNQKKKGFEARGPDPVKGKGGYVDPKTGRSYHIDEENSYGEPPHVDVNRPRGYKGPLEKRRYNM
jgi:hypothetical protein